MLLMRRTSFGIVKMTPLRFLVMASVGVPKVDLPVCLKRRSFSQMPLSSALDTLSGKNVGSRVAPSFGEETCQASAGRHLNLEYYSLLL